jgi:hypothetical protein
MKNLILTLVILLGSFVAKSQTVYRAVMAELYVLNSNKEWTLDTKLSDLKINVTVEEEFITISAKSPTMYRVFINSKEQISSKTLKGYRYSGVDLKSSDNVTIDVMRSTESDIGIISIVNLDKKFNFRYFLEVN